jgi:nitrogen fixation-related uncharacterized protein
MTWDIGITIIWTGFLVIGVVIASAILIWGIRHGQFGDQEHARSLALLSGIPREGSADDGPGRTGA